MQYLGNFAPGATIDLKFTTVNGSGVPTALSSGTISVYKDNGTTESTSGVTLTASFDSRTGMNHVRITTASDGSFYAAGSRFQVVLTGGTVDGNSVVGYVVGHFNLEAEVSNVTHWRGSQVNVLQSGRVDSYVGALASAVITATAIASNAITDAKIASGALTAAKFASGAFDAVWSVTTRTLSAFGFNVTVDTNNDKTGYRLSATGVDDILDEAIAEPSGVFSWPGTLRTIVGWLGALARNKRETTATTDTLRNAADDADIASADLSDDGTTFIRDEWS